MDCDEARRLLNAHLDGENDSASARPVEDHLRICAVCAELARRHGQLSRELRRALPLTAPATLRESLEAQVAAMATPPGARRRSAVAAWAAAAVAAGVVCGWLLARWQSSPSPRELLVHDMVAAHVRSLLPGHLTDVQSSDHHTVKPWFAGRLDYSPWVADLGAQGFPLVGGRLDYVGGRRVAILVYQRRQHVIDLMVSPLGRGGEAVASTTDEGYHVQSWEMQGQGFTAISDLNAAELATFADAVRRSSPEAAGH